ncbi:TYRO protein tyrosine kinase-binding protein isoform X2 [Paramormyrops kingsleyae]|uniref:TYRO protein tyrosine kinase-binding protein n=1 Tax=Paramormyrops kingsleyae TaxID=1676925 RepID=A0A3B3S8E9_9TELE|nr:TYRO protein tyrosine kinase-binding protein [Paramormyrops kingsleyae]XP_023690071.1 TYRO protein tyrosine kinase-binding protein [Paramormyrops kingsleyae]XP_023690078.1 TYRO protein tyrosine kinase-binding protein [Paramormyrops kingsleyae]
MTISPEGTCCVISHAVGGTQSTPAHLISLTNSRMGQTICVMTPVAVLLGPVSGQQECGSCYMLDTGTLVGIIIGDIILTLFIALSVFCFVSRLKMQNGLEALEGKGKIHTSSKKKKAEDLAESPYQELQGVQNDVYSDLRKFRK